jgi:hypothetical protein
MAPWWWQPTMQVLPWTLPSNIKNSKIQSKGLSWLMNQKMAFVIACYIGTVEGKMSYKAKGGRNR